MTRGATAETVDGMSLEKIRAIIELLRVGAVSVDPGAADLHREERLDEEAAARASPRGRTSCCKKSIRSILEAYFEPQFSDRSHGFRPGRGCHTALTEIQTTVAGDDLVHRGGHLKVLRQSGPRGPADDLREKIHDGRFLRLVENLLKAGYLEDWKYDATRSGAPQGGIVSPILSNIYLDRLDRFVEQVLIPEYTRGTERKTNKEYDRLRQASGSRERTDRRRPPICASSCADPVRRARRPRLPAPPIRAVRRRLPARVHRAPG